MRVDLRNTKKGFYLFPGYGYGLVSGGNEHTGEEFGRKKSEMWNYCPE